LMDDGARQEWYRSFLPADVTSNGDPRLVRSYKTVFHGLTALLTAEDLDTMSSLPSCPDSAGGSPMVRGTQRRHGRRLSLAWRRTTACGRKPATARGRNIEGLEHYLGHLLPG
ncbi:hypothetical protein BAE44_0020966, partial [Dichanthelium oligosanthes]